MKAMEPEYKGIPPGMLRRMGKAVRIGVGAALPLIDPEHKPEAIIIGTANGGLEDCILFLNQIVDYDEGLLAPGNFVQSTPNAIAAQLGLMQSNRSYNITHTHRGLAFENALLDAMMMINENPLTTCLLGAVDEISSYNYNIDSLDGWFKKEPVSNLGLYESGTPGSIAGEGSVMFLVNGVKQNATASLLGLKMVHTYDEHYLGDELGLFLQEYADAGLSIDIVLSGVNGDSRMARYQHQLERKLPGNISLLRYKHLCGDFATDTGFATWLSTLFLTGMPIPSHMYYKGHPPKDPKRILIWNTHKDYQHSFILIGKP